MSIATMSPELVICIPGTWADRGEFLLKVITLETDGRYMFAGMVLADTTAKDHVPLGFCPADPNMAEAFEIAGHGKIPPEVLAAIEEHTTVVYLHFPLDLPAQRERIIKFTQIIQRLGGIAVKVESAGISHTWERWFELLGGSPFDWYCSCVVLIADDSHFFSCGMHHFGLPECEVPRSIPIAEAAELMNRFNFWQIDEKPVLSSGHTFSLNVEAPSYRLKLLPDARHDDDHLFYNAHGVWRLEAV
jgi:hypothetical protein